jgi:hypothetical protein
MAEVFIFPESNPSVAFTAPTLMPTAAQSSTYSGGLGPGTPATPATVAVDGSAEARYNYGGGNSGLSFTNPVVEKSWWRVEVPVQGPIFRIALYTRSDGCCTDESIVQKVHLRIRSDAVTDPSSTSTILWGKQLRNTAPGHPFYYYPNFDSGFANSNFESNALDTYLSLELPTWSPTSTSIQISEIRIFMKTNPDTNIILNYGVLGQSSTLGGSPASNAVDGNTATFSHTDGSNAPALWIIYVGVFDMSQVDRVEFVNRVGFESMVGTKLRFRNSSAMGYYPDTASTSNVLIEWNINVVSGSLDSPFIYRVIDIENRLWISQTKFIDSGLAASSLFGSSIDINHEETLMAVGAPGYSSNNGAIWVYKLIGTTWILFQSALVGTGNTGAARQGYSISVSGDTILVGGRTDNSNAGLTWVFVCDTFSCTQQATLFGTGASGSAMQGTNVAIFGDTAVISGDSDSSSVGATWVFTRSAGIWSQQGSKLVGSSPVGQSQQGVGLTIWGDTIAIGGPYDNTNVGAVWVFTRSAGVWSQQGSKLVATGGVGQLHFGYSLCLQRDTLAIGARYDNGFVGSVYIFTRSAGVWTQHSRLVGSNPVAINHVGFSVSLWNDLLVVGGPGNPDVGRTYVYRLTNNVWREVRRLVGTSNIGTSRQGAAVVVRNLTLVTGATNDDSSKGAFWTFRR